MPVFVPVATFRKIVSPQMIGVDPLYAGNGSRQAMFLVSMLAHTVGTNGRPSKFEPGGRCPPRWELSSSSDGPPISGEGAAKSAVPAQVALHVSGRFFSVLTPSCVGPRQCGQF